MKRTKNEVLNSFVYYIVKDAKELLNQEQRKIVKPYIWKYKVSMPMVKVKAVLEKVVINSFDGVTDVLDFCSDKLDNTKYNISDWLHKDPYLIRNLQNEFENKLYEAEDDNGKERWEKFKEENEMKIKTRKNPEIKSPYKKMK